MMKYKSLLKSKYVTLNNLFRGLPKLNQTNKLISTSFKNFSRNLKDSNLEVFSSDKDKNIEKFNKRGKNRETYSLTEGQEIYGFKVNKIHDYTEFQIKGYFLEHLKTGARYYHLDSEDLNNSFSLHFNTPAFDNTGVFHILEHLSLCGSKKFPVRDPFMNMLKRSLNTYMNAWTGPDFTMYPFATQNIKDFKNLFDVYLDATYNPNLDYLDFLQEGWRYEFLDQATKKSGLLFKGVVFNEMKGDMGRQDSYFISKLQSNLFKNSTYNFNSGGDPEFIPKLKYEDLLKTHKKYYHPTNTKFISYGDMNFIENLEILNETVLHKFEKNPNKIFVPNSLRFEEPKEVIDYYQPEMGIGESDVSKFAIAFLCQDINQDTYETFKITDYKHFKKIEEAIFEGLRQVAEKGFETKYIDEILHMVEYDSKKPRDDFAINLLNQSFGFITHSDYPFTLLHVNEFCSRLRNELKSKPVFQILVKKYMLENPHRLKLMLKPKHDLVSDLNRKEADSLIEKEKNLSEDFINNINKDTQSLIDHQNKIQDFNILPSLTIEDIPRFVEPVETQKEKLAFDIPLLYHNQPTNGISFIRMKCNIKDLPQEFKEITNLYSEILPKLGTEQTEYQDFQNKLHTNSSGLNIYIDAYTDINNPEISHENLIFEFSFLDINITKAMKLIEELLSIPNFYDFENLNHLIKQESVRIANEINNNSLEYASDYASSGLLEHRMIYNGFKSDMKICNLGSEIMKTSSPKNILNDLAEKFFLMHKLILRKNNISFSLNGNIKYLESISAFCNFIINAIKNTNDVFMEDLKEDKNKNFFQTKFYQTIIRTPAQVNECVEAFKIPHFNHPDYPKCVIMANLMALKYLHKEIREMGGAYGSGASLSDSGLCTFYSYRDPKPDKSYLIFEKSLVRMSEGKFNEQEIIDSKIYSFSVLDKIINPGNKGLIKFLRNISDEDRNQFRKRLLDVKKNDIVEVANKYFIPQIVENKSSRVMFGGFDFVEDAEMWNVVESFDFLSESYFKGEEDAMEERMK